MARGNFEAVWAESGARSDPGLVKRQLGWIAEKPPHQQFNWEQNYVEAFLQHLERHGVAEWDAATTYAANGIAIGSDGKLYRAVISQQGNDPIVDAGTNWVELLPNADTAVRGLMQIATPGSVAIGIDHDRAVSPFGLASLIASTSFRGLIELATNAETLALVDTERAVTPSRLGALAASDVQRGITRFATQAEFLAGSDGTIAVTPKSLGVDNQSLLTNGWRREAGGLIEQWGRVVAASGTNNFTLPIAFPTAFESIVCSPDASGSAANIGAEPLSLTQFTLRAGSGSKDVFWRARGW